MIRGDEGLVGGSTGDKARPVGRKVLAAAYLRVSSDQQKYSLKNQSSLVAAYARSHGYRIVKRYVDAGKSGLQLKSRAGLQQLLNDVFAHHRKFSTVLVYNVSRWGRFQDLDEASHYEFLCREAGVDLRYCDESFSNDGSPGNFIYKTISRALAAEFSKQLSQEVYLAKKKTAEFGFRTGGPVEFGLSRVLISPGQKERVTLQPGDRKILRSQRVAHALGPKAQVECVGRIFSYALRRRTPGWIAAKLNNEGVPWLEGRSWTAHRVRNVLENELFAGYSVWGRRSRKLKGPVLRLPPHQWTVTENVVPALVSRRQFDKVQQRIQPTCRLSNQEVLLRLKALLQQKGKLSERIIAGSASVPSVGAIFSRFGSMIAAYERIGYRPTQPNFEQMRLGPNGIRFREQLTERLLSAFPDRMERVVHQGCGNRCPVLLVDRKVRLALRVCRQIFIRGKRKWTLKKNLSQNSDLSLLFLMNKAGDAVHAHYLYPSFPLSSAIRFTLGGPFLARGQCLPTLERLPESVLDFVMKSFACVSR